MNQATNPADREAMGVAAMIGGLVLIALVGACLLLCGGCATYYAGAQLDRADISHALAMQASPDEVRAMVDVSGIGAWLAKWREHPWVMSGAALIDAGAVYLAREVYRDARDDDRASTGQDGASVTVNVYVDGRKTETREVPRAKR